MKINSVNNAQSFGMAFKLSKGASKIADDLISNGGLNLEKTIGNLGFLQGRYGKDVVDFSLADKGQKIVATISDQSGTSFLKEVSPKKAFEGGEKLSEKMLKRLNKVRRRQAAKQGAKISDTFFKQNAQAKAAAQKGVTNSFLDKLTQAPKQ